MSSIYRGLWPKVIGKLAKYSIRYDNGSWKISVLYEAGAGLTALLVEGVGSTAVVKINAVKQKLQGQPGGTFYVNEYRHIIVPVNTGNSIVYHYIGRLESDFIFDFNGKKLSTKPVNQDGSALEPGQPWVGPRPGIPYVLAAGGRDIYYETPALTDDEPPQLMPMTTRKVQLSKVLNNNSLLGKTVGPIAAVKGGQGGRFYVNEHGAIFTPINRGDGNGIDYTYCGLIQPEAWFPEPMTADNAVVTSEHYDEVKI